MGTKMAPSYAIIYMDQLERELLQHQKPPTKFFRFIDDIIMLYDHGEEELAKLLDHMNTFHPTIKFTYEFSRESVNFMDIKIMKAPDGKIITDLYTKATDAHAYLYYTSCHPPHTSKSLPYSQALRICKIC